jgi:hypothetical protein
MIRVLIHLSPCYVSCRFISLACEHLLHYRCIMYRIADHRCRIVIVSGLILQPFSVRKSEFKQFNTAVNVTDIM